MAWSLPNSLHTFTFVGLSLRCGDLRDFVDPDDFFRAALTTTEMMMALAAIISFTIFFVFGGNRPAKISSLQATGRVILVFISMPDVIPLKGCIIWVFPERGPYQKS